MKRILVSFLVALSLAAQAQAPLPPEIAARNYVLIDLTAHKTLAEREADAPQDPASLTKLMTAYVAFGALRDKKLALDQTLPVSRRAASERKGDLMFIDTTMTPKVDELLRGLIVQNGNDAAVALAEGVSGSVENFVQLMNRQAQAWGLKNTEFKNVTGLSEPGQKSTARDMATVAAHIITDFPEYYGYYAQRDYIFNKIRQDNGNLLLRRDPTVDGLKAGFADGAGFSLVASANREFPNGKRRLLSVVMGTASKDARAGESQKLLNWGYTAFDAVKIFDAGKAIKTVSVWKGEAKEAKLGAADAVYVAVPRGDAGKLQTQVEHIDPLVAPLNKGQRVGTLRITTTTGTPVAEVPLIVQEAVPVSGLFGRAFDSIRLWIK
ncbi:D-alanyl-D-alanine carboxypeptidase family protein [Roseateles sp. BYS78W]|uniref:serine-type D-Ala-D-Ala carboxypeptidase n=1 Tax=Pelomonas candidula TaxID=3299025 RepID=A0ABW7H576_9BURK